MLSRLADRIHARPRRVLAVAAALALAAGAAGGSVAERLHPYGADDPASESVQARERLERVTGVEPAAGIVALVRPGAPVRSAGAEKAVTRVARRLGREPEVGRVTTFYGTGDRTLVSRDGRATYVVAQLDRRVGDKQAQEAGKRIGHELEGTPGVTLGGWAVANQQVNAQVESDLKRAELLVFPLLFALSLLFFRSVVAALLPLLVGGLAIVATFAVLRIASEMTVVSIFALNLTTGLGLGLAIDYSLFIVSRYREELARSGPGPEALRATMRTAGRTVMFSSLTVAAALAALLTFPQRFLYSMGLGGMLVALIAAAIALLVLPAVLALLGPRVNALAPRWLRRAAEREARAARAGGWYRLSRFVMRRPARVAIASGAALLAMGLPFLGIRFIAIDASMLPETASARQVDDALAREFPSNRTEPLQIVAGTRPGPALRDYADRVEALDGASRLLRPQPLPGGGTLLELVPRHDAVSPGSEDLVHDVRALPAPFPVDVAGRSAAFVDQKASLAGHLPLAIAIVFGATFVVLFLMTGSVVLPVKAALMNLLTLSAAFGLLVTVFQHGRLEGVLDYTSQGGIESTMPLLLFAVVFGLSTDYAVFLLSRIKEARDGGASDSEAVALGLERTGRIVTAAALLFSIAIAAFATSEIVFLKQNGLGTAAAVLIDATIVRALLVPSLMELLGRWNWWSPAPLRRLHARIRLREAEAEGSGA
jgi:RND superfamily putative drug exporter